MSNSNKKAAPVRKAGMKQDESRSNLLSKIKFLEDELTKMDVDRNRLLHQLDKVCEEKDEEIKQLKGLLYEKNVEFDHQMNLAKEGKKGLHDEIQDLKNMMAFQKAAAENDVHQLASEKAQLIQKLQDLKEYMDNKEMTMARIKELEDLLSNERVIFENKVTEFREQMEQEKQKTREQITKEVQEISQSMESTCLKKMSRDAKLALEKIVQVSEKLEATEKELKAYRKDNESLTHSLHAKKLRLEVAEGLLNEMLKQMQRRINSRKDASAQVNMILRDADADLLKHLSKARSSRS